MANLLIADADGRRRVALEVAAARLGHRTYCAGTPDETLRLARIYIPDALVLALSPAESGVVIQALRESDRAGLRELPIVTTSERLKDQPHVTAAPANRLMDSLPSFPERAMPGGAPDADESA